MKYGPPLLLAAILAALPVNAEEDGSTKLNGAPLPGFATLRFTEINLRTGPGTRYPIEWVYRRAGLPVEVTNAFDHWYRIRDFEGTEGWVHKTQLRMTRRGMATGQMRTVREDADDKAKPVAHLEPGVMFDIESCEMEWCEVASGNFKGYLRKGDFYGAYPQETFD